MYQFIYNQALAAQPIVSRFFVYLRRLILKFHDPIVSHKIDQKEILINMSHDTPFFQKYYPTYSANLSRLAAFVRARFGTLVMIDVGANIGDSYCLAGGEDTDQYLLIEGEPNYFNLLTQNTKGKESSVTLVQVYLSDKPNEDNANILIQGGTARIIPTTASGTQLYYYTLDQVIQSHQQFLSCNLLKIDVDGYDCKVLRGGINFIARTKPTILFEYHPHLLASSDTDAPSIFEILSGLGYRSLIFYDNFGFLVTVIDTEQTTLIKDLVSYAMQKNGYYYDICCFHDDYSHHRNCFLDEERIFYNELIYSTQKITVH